MVEELQVAELSGGRESSQAKQLKHQHLVYILCV